MSIEWVILHTAHSPQEKFDLRYWRQKVVGRERKTAWNHKQNLVGKSRKMFQLQMLRIKHNRNDSRFFTWLSTFIVSVRRRITRPRIVKHDFLFAFQRVPVPAECRRHDFGASVTQIRSLAVSRLWLAKYGDPYWLCSLLAALPVRSTYLTPEYRTCSIQGGAIV